MLPQTIFRTVSFRDSTSGNLLAEEPINITTGLDPTENRRVTYDQRI